MQGTPARTVPAPQSKKRIWQWAGCLGVVAGALCCLGGLAVSANYTETNAMRSGLEAFNAGDCRQALEHFDKVLDNSTFGFGDADDQASPLARECRDFQRAVDQDEAEDHPAALLAYLDFPGAQPDSSLNDFVPDRVAGIFSRADAAELATIGVCDRARTLGDTGWVPDPDEHLPNLYYHCGETYEADDQLGPAVNMYTLVTTDYPAHDTLEAAREGLARVTIEMARRAGAGEISAPSEVGTAPAGTAEYEVRNDSPVRMRIVLTGPEVVIEEVEPCATCVRLTAQPDDCPNQGPVVTLTLKPGIYQVLVESISDEGVTPYVGDWEFSDGSAYRDCFYIVTQSGQ